MTLGIVQLEGQNYAVTAICPVPIPSPLDIEEDRTRNLDSDGYQKMCQICDEYAAYHFIRDISFWVCDQCRIDIHNYDLNQPENF